MVLFLVGAVAIIVLASKPKTENLAAVKVETAQVAKPVQSFPVTETPSLLKSNVVIAPSVQAPNPPVKLILPEAVSVRPSNFLATLKRP